MEAPLRATPLPQNPFCADTEQDWHNAFDSCKQLENANGWGFFGNLSSQREQPEPVMLATRPAVAARTLGYALIHAPSTEARNRVATDVKSCGENPEFIAGLAHIFIFGLIRIFKNPKGLTPMASADSSPRPSFGNDDQDEPETLGPSGATPVWLRDKVVTRDHHHCIFTGRPDETAAINYIMEDDGDIEVRHLQVAHIISQSLTSEIGGLTDNARAKFAWASSPAAIFDRFSSTQICDILAESELHLPVNTMMASREAHMCFNMLGLWLTPLTNRQGETIPNAYRTHVANPKHRRWYHILPEVHFGETTFNNDEVVPPPHDVLLAVHAACAQIAHLSGAAEVLDDFDRDEEPEKLLSLSRGPYDMSSNSASFAALERALNRVEVGGGHTSGHRDVSRA